MTARKPGPLGSLLLRDAAQPAPPVVYFHQQDPQALAAEIDAYVLTAGPEGAHAALLSVLDGVRDTLARDDGVALPAVWLSGSFGSGKSSFAKVLGLALEGTPLPDGRSFTEALLQRDDSARAPRLREALTELVRRLRPRVALFELGSAARAGEPFAQTALREAQRRLGYCARSERVARFELLLERDGRWPRFLEVAEKSLGKPWHQAQHDALAEEHFSHALHALEPARYQHPMSWLEARSDGPERVTVNEVVDSLEGMLAHRAPGATLFLVADEAGQHLREHPGQTLALQSFVSALGQRLRGRAWLVATGQQRLDAPSEREGLGALSDRFPAALRAHLGSASAREVLHRRLLQKKPAHEAAMRALFRAHRAELELYALAAEGLDERAFVELYPLLPAYLPLLEGLTAALHAREGHGLAARGLLQLVGSVLREQGLAALPVGALITLDALCDAQRGALDPAVGERLDAIDAHPLAARAPFVKRVARAVALLQLTRDARPVTAELVARCLYARLGEGSLAQPAREALDALCAQQLVSYSERHGYALESAEGRAWQLQRDELPVPRESLVELVRDTLRAMLARVERPRLLGRALAWGARFVYGPRTEPLAGARASEPEAPVALHFFWHGEPCTDAHWTLASQQGEARDRLHWVAVAPASLEDDARALARSRHTLAAEAPRRGALGPEASRLLREEELREESLSLALERSVGALFCAGALWFRGRPVAVAARESGFAPSLRTAMHAVLPLLYPSATEHAVSARELEQLVQPTLVSPPALFLEGGLGLLALDGGRYVATCSGPVPAAVAHAIASSGGLEGGALLEHFSRPPCGWPGDVVKACVAALVRAGRIAALTPQGARVAAVNDAGARSLFEKDSAFRAARFVPAGGAELTARERTAVARFFEERFGAELEREDEALADAAWAHLPPVEAQLRATELALRAVGRWPHEALSQLALALERCRSSRRAQDTVRSLSQSLATLRAGLDALALAQHEAPPQENAHPVAVRGRELATEAELAALEAELRAFVLRGVRVRLV